MYRHKCGSLPIEFLALLPGCVAPGAPRSAKVGQCYTGEGFERASVGVVWLCSRGRVMHWLFGTPIFALVQCNFAVYPHGASNLLVMLGCGLMGDSHAQGSACRWLWALLYATR